MLLIGKKNKRKKFKKLSAAESLDVELNKLR
jgi:hypothetical protein